jgi:hypothetical protein
MPNILPFRRKTPDDNSATEPPPPEVHGLIEIKSTDHGDMVNVTGAYVDRLQHGVVAAIKLLNIFADKIMQSDGAGYASSPSLRETIPRPRKLAPRFLETTDLAPLEPQRRKR